MIPLMIVKIGQKYAEGSSGLCRRRHNSGKLLGLSLPNSRKNPDKSRLLMTF